MSAFADGKNMSVGDPKGIATSFIISGSTVAVVGMIFIITITWAFIGMLAFGLIMVVLGVLTVRRKATQGGVPGDGPDKNP